MKTMEISRYHPVPASWTVLCNDQPLTCAEIARKANAVGVSRLSFCGKLYLFIIDFFAHYFNYFKQKQFTKIQRYIAPLIQKQNQFLAEREEIQTIVQQQYTVIAKNVDHLDEAEVICLGETHDIDSHRFTNGELIDALSEPTDRVLVEVDEAMHQLSDNDQAKYVTRPLQKQGWDKRTPTSDFNYIQYLFGWTTFRASFVSLLGTSFVSLLGTPFLSLGIGLGGWPFAVLNLGGSIAGYFMTKRGVQAIIDDVPARNRHMCQTIERQMRPDKRIYVIGGSNHFRSTETTNKNSRLKWECWLLGINRAPQDVSYQETLAYLRTKKFAILIPR